MKTEICFYFFTLEEIMGGADFLLLQCSPQLEEMERFAGQVIHAA